MIKDVQEKKISFYTAECMEFETMGEVTECATLKEAFRIYQKMEQKRSGMGVGIGFILHDPDVPEYSDNLTSMCTQQEIEEKMIKQQKQILQLELEKRKLLEENQRLREVCGILGKEKRENEIRQNSRY